MATLNDIDRTLPMGFAPRQHDLEVPVMRLVDGIDPIVLAGEDIQLFLDWAGQSAYRESMESDLQCLAMDSQKRDLLTTWLPLVTFRESLCNGGRHLQNSKTQALMERLRMATREWRAAGVDTVDISGRKRV